MIWIDFGIGLYKSNVVMLVAEAMCVPLFSMILPWIKLCAGRTFHSKILATQLQKEQIPTNKRPRTAKPGHAGSCIFG